MDTREYNDYLCSEINTLKAENAELEAHGDEVRKKYNELKQELAEYKDKLSKRNKLIRHLRAELQTITQKRFVDSCK